jgi:hypothetical protein
MQDKKHYKIDENTLDKIIAAAYKDASLADRIKIYLLAKRNPEVKRIFNEYRNTSNKIKEIPLYECPDSVTESLTIKTSKEIKSPVIRPAYGFALAILIASTLIAILLNQNKEEEAAYTKAEIELAEQQVKESLAIVNKVFKKTENLIQEEILPKRVGKPIHKSLSIINEVLIGG